MKLKAAEISEIIRRQIRDYDREVDVAETGTVLSVGDGIARVHGLANAMAGELVEFAGGVRFWSTRSSATARTSLEAPTRSAISRITAFRSLRE